MNCPKCGKELLEGRLYCEHCGGEINLVPEFEAEIEQSMAESIQGIAEDVGFKAEVSVEHSPSAKGVFVFTFLTCLAAMLVFMVSTVFSSGITIWKHSTFIQEMLISHYLENEEYEEAIASMEGVIKKEPNNISYMFKLSDMYMQKGNAEQALQIYKDIVDDDKYTLDEQIFAVEKIIKYYANRDDFQQIADYLETVQDENIKMAFMEYMSGMVEFSRPEGTYATMITLKLLSDGIGTIYYTTDGTKPDTKSQVYQNMIFLEPGDNVISAVFVNDYGVSSQIITKKYFIESRKVSPPEVLTYSGSYTRPVKVEVAASVDSTIYYTDDGSIPSRNSKRYMGELYAPLGKSVYKFVAIGYNGESSDVVTRNIQVTLNTQISPEEAKDLLIQYQMEKNGAISDGMGHIVQDETHIFIYEYLYPMTSESNKDCYYFAEVSRDITNQEQYRTNRYFAVDVTSGDIYTFN